MTPSAMNSSAAQPDVQGSSTEISGGDVEVLHACQLCGADSLGVLDSTANLCECYQRNKHA